MEKLEEREKRGREKLGDKRGIYITGDRERERERERRDIIEKEER